MNTRFEELVLPRYIDAADPPVLAALDIYGDTNIIREGYGGTLHNRRALTLFEFIDRTPYVAWQDDTIVAVANFRANDRLKGHSFLEALVVDKRRRREGFGKFMIDNLVRVTDDLGLENMRLRPLEQHVGYYATLGFIADEIVPKDSTRPFMTVNVAEFLARAQETRLAA